MKSKLFHDPVFCIDVRALSGTLNEARTWMKNHDWDFEPSEQCEGFCSCSGSFIIWLKNPKDFYILMHESLHLVGKALKDCGVPDGLMLDSGQMNETVAYYHMFWFRKLWRYYGNLRTTRKANRSVVD